MSGPEQACADVTAVVVTHHPDIAQLLQLLDILHAQVGQVVIVDNGSGPGLAAALAPALAVRGREAWELLRKRDNLGIAAAQNLGAERALARPGCHYVLLCDQDSLPAPYMVQQLRAALRARPAAGAAPLAAAGPWTVDQRSGAHAVLVVDRGRGPRRWHPPPPAPLQTPPQAPLRSPPQTPAPAPQAPPAPGAASPVDVALLIASGSLLPAAVLHRLRGMRGEYFIDHVDTEWCLRARAAGYRLAVVPTAQLRHRLGDTVRTVWFFGRRQVAWHTPLRDYYMFRNTLLMLRDLPLSGAWRRHLLWRLLQYAGYFVVLGDQRVLRLRRMLLGLRHGRSRSAGRLDPVTGRCDRLEPTALDPAFGHPHPGQPVLPTPPGGIAR